MLNILIVDDIDINIKVISSILSFKKNIKTSSAKRAAEALELIEKNEFDIIITDIFMPEMDGFQFADIIHDNHNKIPMIAVSAGNQEVKENCKAHHIEYYLSKPIIPTELYEIIETISATRSEGTSNKEGVNVPVSELLNKLKDYTGGNINLLKKLLKKYLEILPLRVNELESILSKDHQKITEEKIHNLKGFSLIYVSEDTGNLIKQFEIMFKESLFDLDLERRVELFNQMKENIFKDYNDLKDIYNNL